MPPAYRPARPRQPLSTPSRLVSLPVSTTSENTCYVKHRTRGPVCALEPPSLLLFPAPPATRPPDAADPPARATAAPRPVPASPSLRARRHGFRVLRPDSQNRLPGPPRLCRIAAARPPAGRPCARNRVRRPVCGATQRRPPKRPALAGVRRGRHDGREREAWVSLSIPVRGFTHAHRRTRRAQRAPRPLCRGVPATGRHRRAPPRLR